MRNPFPALGIQKPTRNLQGSLSLLWDTQRKPSPSFGVPFFFEKRPCQATAGQEPAGAEASGRLSALDLATVWSRPTNQQKAPDVFGGVLVWTIFLSKGPGPECQVPCQLLRGYTPPSHMEADVSGVDRFPPKGKLTMGCMLVGGRVFIALA